MKMGCGMIRAKYLKKMSLAQCRQSPAYFYTCCERLLGHGCKTRFWKDMWLGQKPLYMMFLRLYNLTFSQHIIVNNVLLKVGLI
jgi:hypothetical protein